MDHSPIVSPESLYARLGSPDLRIVDVRWVMGSPGAGQLGYAAGHIPGAIFLDLDTDLAGRDGPGRHPLPVPADFRERLEGAGIGDADHVVVYDDVGGWIAARLWWMLDNLGHERVRLLDGGLPAWIAAGFPVTAAAPEPRARGQLSLLDAWTGVIDRADLTEGLGGFVLLDARGGPRYRGEVEPIDAVPGHIPTARSAPADGNVGADGRMLPAAVLAERFGSLGATGEGGPVVTSCGSGVTACFNSLAMRVAGLPEPILYAGSYSDWSRAGMPIASGPEPGDPPGAQIGER
jgi:thiosulfate/3-mercaptopyruvate sulfurtransferase